MRLWRCGRVRGKLLLGAIAMKSKKTAEASIRRPRRVATAAEARLARHRAQCRICRHAEREEIEQEFLDWVPAREIAAEYKLGSHRAVYRHGHALSLFRARRGHIERVLDSVIERSGEAKITAASVVSAIRLLVELNMPEKQFLLELLQGSAGWIFAKPTPAPGEAVFVADLYAAEDDDGKGPGPSASPHPRPSLKPPAKAASAQVKLMIAPDLPREKSERHAAPVAYAAKEDETKAKAEPPKPPALAKPPAPPKAAAPADPALARGPAAPEPGTRQEPDGPPQVAGMAWPWAKGSSPFARRERWRGRPVVG
jgi:hypothetical protein